MLHNFTKGYFNKCSIPGCSGGGKDTFTIYRHFAGRYPRVEIVILGNKDTVKYDLCGQKCYNLERHKKTKICKKISLKRKNEKHQDL